MDNNIINSSTTATTGFNKGSLSNYSSNNKNMFLNVKRSDNQDTNDISTASCTTTTPTESGSESPPSTNLFNDFSKNIITPSTSSISSPKKSSRRSVQKRVVSIPIKEVEGSRLKGETSNTSTPPSDSWAWRKYGQKPIKGSPYPRGYYRCSSSKGCPARKQVERSRVDPTMLVVTYSAEHNHPWPSSSRSNHHHHHHHHNNSNSNNQSSAATSASRKPVKEEDHDEEELDEVPESTRADMEPEPGPEMGRIGFMGDELMGPWFGVDGHMETAASSVLESPMTFADGGGACDSLAAVFPVNMMGEEDESLFADLGELPECSLVFRHRGAGPQVEIC